MLFSSLYNKSFALEAHNVILYCKGLSKSSQFSKEKVKSVISTWPSKGLIRNVPFLGGVLTLKTLDNYYYSKYPIYLIEFKIVNYPPSVIYSVSNS